MILLAKVVPYGGNSVRYAMDKENAKVVKVNHMPDDVDATSVWYMMKHHCQLHQADRTVGRKLERFMVTFVASPSKEESKNFTMDDWAKLQDECLAVLDSLGIMPKDMNREVKTNFAQSMNVGALHSDSKSGTLHLHIDCCRVDMDGNTNDVHDVHIRAMKAAEVINMRYGWQQPQDIREMRRQEVADSCEEVLKEMERFDFDDYFSRLRDKCYEVKTRYDKNNKLVGYTIGKNASVFKASAIGRKYMVSRLEASWRKLHVQPRQFTPQAASTRITPQTQQQSQSQSSTQVSPQPKATPLLTIPFSHNGEMKYAKLPSDVYDVLKNEAQVPADNESATVTNVANVALLLFVGYFDAATSISESCGGGGSSPQSGWGKDDDEDDLKFARRCLRMAQEMCKPKPFKRKR